MTAYTYRAGRKCPYCLATIPDQKHKALKFCDHKEQGKTSRESCKNKYWSLRKGPGEKPYRDLVNLHKFINRQITDLVAVKGSTVTVSDLTQFRIDLSYCVRLKTNKEQKRSFYFIGYIINELLLNQFKIEKNALHP